MDQMVADSPETKKRMERMFGPPGLNAFRQWLSDCQRPPHTGTDYTYWLDPKEVLERFDAAMKAAD